MFCTYCGSSCHTQGLCPKTAAGSVARRQLWCSYCGSREHNVPACPKTHSGNAARSWHPDTVADHFVKD